MAVFDEILWDDPFVDHHLFGQVVFRILFLEQGTPLVLFVGEDGFDRAALPVVFPRGGLDTKSLQFPADSVKREARKKLTVDQPDRFGFLFVHYQFPVLATVVAEEMAERNHWFSVSKSLPPAPGHVERNAPAFFLRKARHDGQ